MAVGRKELKRCWFLRICLAASMVTVACAPSVRQQDFPPPSARVDIADPAKLLTSQPGAAILDARISSLLRVRNGCLVVGDGEARTVLWPAGTRLALDRRAVIVPGAARPLAIGERFVAAGGTVPLASPPAPLQDQALRNGCPGTLVAIGQIISEE
jgi:hypothetical protein